MFRPVTDVRPLAVYAAWLTTEFECLAPSHWGADTVLEALFTQYEFAEAGWKQAKVTMTELQGTQYVVDGTKMLASRWKISRG